MSKTMNLRDKLYQRAVVDRIAGRTGEAPFVVELDPTAACDLACPGCISEDLIALGNSFKGDRLLKLGQEMIDFGVKAVILIGGGEPLAHPKAGELINLLGSNDVHIGITTNGSFIDRYLQPISEYSKWTRVSMDAATEETFSRLRPTKGKGAPNKFKKIIANMRLLAKSKKGKLGYSYLIQTPADGVGENNIDEIYPAAELARDIGCDYFEVKPSYQFRDGVDHALTKHPPELMARAREAVGRLDALETPTFRILKAINLEPSLSGVDTPQTKGYRACPSTALRTTVTPTGVFVCPYWRGKDHMKVGDVNHMSFADVWLGYQRMEVMGRLDATRDCQFHCLRNDTNLTVRKIQQQLWGGVEVSTVEEFDRFI